MQNNTSKITVVTVCYNAEKELERTMLSVLNQTYPNLEYIVIDGGSTDGSVEIIRKYEDRLAFWVSEPDKGIYDAMNKGIAHATGEWINFMNVGDKFVDEKIIEKIFSHKINNEVGVIWGKVRMLIDGVLYSCKSKPFYEGAIDKGMCHQCMFLKTVFTKKYPYDLKYKIAADYAMAHDIYYKEKAKFLYVDLDVAEFDPNGKSSSNPFSAYYEDLCILNNGKCPNRFITNLKYLFKSLLKRGIKSLIKFFYPSLILKWRKRNMTPVSMK